MDIRPHRRLAIPLEPPLFDSLAQVADFAGTMFEHFGVAIFGPGALAGSPVHVFRRMCDSLGLRMLVDCRDQHQDFAIAAVSAGADYVLVSGSAGRSCVSSLLTSCRLAETGYRLPKILISVLMFSDASEFSPLPVGYFCEPTLVASLKALDGVLSVFADCPDQDSVVASVKAGADFVVVRDLVVKAEDPTKAARLLAEAFREFT